MHSLRRVPQRGSPIGYLCTQCRHATTKTTPKAAKDHVAIEVTTRDLNQRSADLRHRVHSARKARREDWQLGPLAPDRAAEDPEYGCVQVRELRGVKGLQRTRQGRSPYMAPEMKWEDSLVQVGDRVMVVAREGPASREWGKIGTVSEVQQKDGECVIEDMNLADIKVPASVRSLEPNSIAIRTVPLPLPLSAVRVVCRMTHPDGITCDTIIEKMVKLPNRPGRYIANSDRASGKWQKVPKARAPKAAEKEKETHDADTLRYEVEEVTWTPTLLRAPMPGGVIDELRNKYSKYRTRHEPRYQLALDNRERRKAEWKAWAKSGGSMLSSPAREAAARARDEKAAMPRPTLRREILEKIGEVMAGKGIELTDARRREMERNLVTEAVVAEAEGGGEVMRAKAEIVVEGEGEGEGEGIIDTEGEVQDAIDRLGINEIVLELEEGRDGGKPVR